MSCSTGQRVLKRLLVTVLGLLCTQVCCVTGLEVTQSPPDLSLQEGASSMLQCNFSMPVNRVQWFRQNPGGHLTHLFYIPSGTKQNGRLNSTTVAKDGRSSLYISSSQTTDSAIYFCAGAEPQTQ
uniref:T cell receptor alpha variable 22 n=1 Tax=Suricata suricatta TaxID=37032 RepID=A0A673TGI1_SURSU